MYASLLRGFNALALTFLPLGSDFCINAQFMSDN
jgi:hypothetical protein